MAISARNQYQGKIVSVISGAVNGIINIDINGTGMAAIIDNSMIDDMGLKSGIPVTALVRAKDVMLEMDGLQFGARNQYRGFISSVQRGAVNSVVEVTTDGFVITSTVSNEEADIYGMVPGAPATAIIRASSVLISA